MFKGNHGHQIIIPGRKSNIKEKRQRINQGKEKLQGILTILTSLGRIKVKPVITKRIIKAIKPTKIEK